MEDTHAAANKSKKRGSCSRARRAAAVAKRGGRGSGAAALRGRSYVHPQQAACERVSV